MIKFTEKLPEDGIILVAFLGDTEDLNAIVDAFEEGEKLMRWGHVETMTAERTAFGIKLYHGAGRGAELSDYDYECVKDSGRWMTLESFIQPIADELEIVSVIEGSHGTVIYPAAK